MRLSRLRHLRHVEQATDSGQWCDLGKATGALRAWMMRHGLCAPRPNPHDPAWPSWRNVKITDKGRESLRVAHAEYIQKRGGLQ